MTNIQGCTCKERYEYCELCCPSSQEQLTLKAIADTVNPNEDRAEQPTLNDIKLWCELYVKPAMEFQYQQAPEIAAGLMGKLFGGDDES